MNSSSSLPETADTVKTTLENLSSFDQFYEEEVKKLVEQIIDQEKEEK